MGRTVVAFESRGECSDAHPTHPTTTATACSGGGRKMVVVVVVVVGSVVTMW